MAMPRFHDKVIFPIIPLKRYKYIIDRYEKKTFVLDFVNKYEDIEEINSKTGKSLQKDVAVKTTLQKGGSSVRRDGIGNEAVIWNKQSRKIICNEVKA